MTTLLENELPLSLVMQAVDGPLIVTQKPTGSSAGEARPRPTAVKLDTQR
jgi:hypothetical protein